MLALQEKFIVLLQEFLRSVFEIAHKGKAGIGKLNADLVFASGVNANFHKTCVVFYGYNLEG